MYGLENIGSVLNDYLGAFVVNGAQEAANSYGYGQLAAIATGGAIAVGAAISGTNKAVAGSWIPSMPSMPSVSNWLPSNPFAPKAPVAAPVISEADAKAQMKDGVRAAFEGLTAEQQQILLNRFNDEKGIFDDFKGRTAERQMNYIDNIKKVVPRA